tara:strand:+ start:3390 stop:4268 length:879 start_codon:yes stop_codon:yes gene_type:complete
MSKKVLYHNQPKRLFTFGCSFTHYMWGTWANALGQELDCEFVNFGRSGAGNHFIFNMLMQADAVYDFTHEDLVIVQWTNVCREDRYVPQDPNGPWMTPGNIYSQKQYREEFVRDYFSEYGAYVRDLAFIKAGHEMLKHKTQYHFLQMCDILDQTDQWTGAKRDKNHRLDDMMKYYGPSLNELLPSFYQTLFNNNIETKFKRDKKLITKNFQDGHPSPMEHYLFLKDTFKHEWKDSTDRAVEEAQNKWIKLLKDASELSKDFHLFKMKQRWLDMFYYETNIKPDDKPDPIIHF